MIGAFAGMLTVCIICLGPTSMAHAIIEPEGNGNWKVKYLPVEVGEYLITVLWNDVEVACEFVPGLGADR